MAAPCLNIAADVTLLLQERAINSRIATLAKPKAMSGLDCLNLAAIEARITPCVWTSDWSTAGGNFCLLYEMHSGR